MIHTFAALLLAVAVATTSQAEAVPEPEGYREDAYRAPVPETLTGGTVVDAEEAHTLWEAGTAFIDVLPQAPKPANLPKGTIWREKVRNSIPGAIWLPNVGYGKIAPVTADYFRKGLKAATGDDPTKTVVIFCLADCWMSWNAAKRAIELGYTAVYWFPDGSDGWEFFDYPLEPLQPHPGQPQTE